jgi:Mg-chelatase subunit ChlD
LGQVALTFRCTPDNWHHGRESAKKKARQAQRRTLLVLVVDESGSMAGTFSRQVVPALITIVGQVQQS